MGEQSTSVSGPRYWLPLQSAEGKEQGQAPSGRTAQPQRSMGHIGPGRAPLDPDVAREQGCLTRALAEAMDGVDQRAVCGGMSGPSNEPRVFAQRMTRAKNGAPTFLSALSRPTQSQVAARWVTFVWPRKEKPLATARRASEISRSSNPVGIVMPAIGKELGRAPPTPDEWLQLQLGQYRSLILKMAAAALDVVPVARQIRQLGGVVCFDHGDGGIQMVEDVAGHLVQGLL